MTQSLKSIHVLSLITYLFKTITCLVYDASGQSVEKFSSIAGDIPHVTLTLDISQNNIQNLKDRELSYLSKLEILKISANQLVYMSPTCLEDTKLTMLYISQNVLAAFPNLTVVSDTLNYLDLSLNSIENIPCESIQVLRQLTELNLSSNLITAIPGTCYSVTLSLITLNLLDNKITIVTNTSFLGMTKKLRSISFSKYLLKGSGDAFINQLPTRTANLEMDTGDLTDQDLVGFKHKSDMHFLVSLTIVRNDIESMPILHRSSAQVLSKLDLQYNKLSVIPLHMLDNFPNLKYLYINNNRLSYLPELTSLTDHPLLHLIVKYNDINIMTTTGLTSLEVFSAQNNSLSQVILLPTKIKTLAISHNNLEHLDVAMLPHLRKLYASYNKLSCIHGNLNPSSKLNVIVLSHNIFKSCSMKWLSKIQRIEKLKIANAELRYFPNIIPSSNSIFDIVLTNNRIEMIQPELLEGLTALQSLVLSRNYLTSLPWMEASPIKNLFVDWNQLQYFPNLSGKMNNTLKRLHLQHNLIQTVCYKDISMLSALEEIILHHNQLKYITSYITFLSAETVDVTSNKFICDCHLIWLKNATNVVLSLYPCEEPTSIMKYSWDTITVQRLLDNCPDSSSCQARESLSTANIVGKETTISLLPSLIITKTVSEEMTWLPGKSLGCLCHVNRI